MAGDNFTREDAEAQAKMIRGYWARRGYAVKTDVLPLGKDATLTGKKKLTGFKIVTDMINGMPVALCRDRTIGNRVKNGGKLA